MAWGNVMAEPVKLNVGDLLGSASDELRGAKKSVLTYFAIFVPLVAISSYLDVSLGMISGEPGQAWNVGFEYGGLGLLVLIASVVGQMWLFGKMLGVEVELNGANAPRILAFIGVAIVTALGVMLATVLLIVPGLFVGSRWLMSPAFFVHDRETVFDALGKSWEATKGNTRIIMLCAFLVILGLLALSALAELIAALGILAINVLVGAILNEIFGVIFIALSVATFRKLVVGSGQIAQVFE